MPHNRLYISADIEGIAGVVSGEHTMPAGFEYNQAREWMTNEVLAACSAAFDNGIKDIVISDSHGNGQNLLLDRLPTGTQLVRSWPRPLCMMAKPRFWSLSMKLVSASSARHEYERYT